MAIHLAAIHGKDDVTKMLIEEFQADPNARTDSGMTPLHLACKHDQVGNNFLFPFCLFILLIFDEFQPTQNTKGSNSRNSA